ncbi:MAG TPA: hypothetical protein VGC29_05745 [Flavisolibacter sp.]
MQNEFEKQVKQKMEELDFVPSTPVWQKIEEQIRHKKDRRRIIFWLPLLLLLTGGGITWFALNENKSGKMAVETQTIEPAQSSLPKTSTNETTGSIPGTTRNIPVENTPVAEINGQSGETTPMPSSPNSSIVANENIQAERVQKNQFKKNGGSRSRESSRGLGNKKEEHIIAFNQGNTSKPGQSISRETVVNENEVNRKLEPVKSLQEDTAARIIETVNNPQDFVEKKTGPVDVENNDAVDSVLTGTVTPIAKNFGKSKWKLGLVVKAGVSGTVEGLDINTTKSMEFQNAPNNAPPPPPALYRRSYGPSEMKNMVSFGAGFLARKQLNKRLAFVTGLHYQYMAASTRVGYKRPSLATGNTSNFQDAYSALAVVDYTNRFHFISLPLAMDFQLLKRKPLNIQFGVAYQQMVATNAVYFDYASQLYIKDKDQFSSGQIFTDLGLNYSFPVKKFPVSIGPYVQYSLTALDENSKKQYLYSLGLKTTILFQKK